MAEPRKTKDVMHTSNLGEGAIRSMKKNGISVVIDKNLKYSRGAYTKRKFLRVSNSFDAFENLLVVRRYVQERYDITIQMLEIMLYLYPKQYFTQEDYRKIPKQYKYARINSMLLSGIAKIAADGLKNKGDRIYCLSAKSKGIVVHFYECLSGERKMSEWTASNPMALAGASNYDKKTLELIKSINKMEVPESRKSLYIKNPDA